MKFDPKTKRLHLSSGKSVEIKGPFELSFANGSLAYGVEGFLFENGKPFAIEDRAEIGVYMILAWQRWIETGSPSGKPGLNNISREEVEKILDDLDEATKRNAEKVDAVSVMVDSINGHIHKG